MKKTWFAFACSAMVLGGAIAQVPNDNCATATWLQTGVNPGAPNGVSGSFFSNVGSGGNEVGGFCTAGVDSKDVWFQWASFGSGTATVTTSTPLGFTPGTATVSIEAYAWCGGPVTACSQPAPLGGATLSLSVLNGGIYIIRVATIAPTMGGGTFYLTLTSPPSPPPNDHFVNWIPVYPGANPTSGTFTTIAATPDGTGACTTPGEIDVWFVYQPATSGTATLSTPGAILGIRITNSTGGVVVCGTTSFPVSFPVTAGSTNVIRIASQSGAGTNFTITMVPPAPPPPNDECVNAIPLTLGANGPFPASNASPSPGFASCTQLADVWYSFTNGSCTTAYTVEACGVWGLGIVQACNGPSLCAYGGAGSGCRAIFFTALANTTYQFCLAINAVGFPLNAAHTITITPGIFVSGSSTSYLPFDFTSPFGPGSIQASALAGPPSGVWYLAATPNQGSFPNGPAYGLDMTFAELLAQFMSGPPFTGAFDSCGAMQLGPFAGLPPGLTIYSVLFGFAGGYSATPTIYSYPQSYTIP